MHAQRLGVGVTEAQETRCEQQKRHEDDAARLGHVAAKGGDHVHDEFGEGFEIAVHVGLGREPRRRRDGLQVVGQAAQAHGAAMTQVHEVRGQHVAQMLWWGGGRRGIVV